MFYVGDVVKFKSGSVPLVIAETFTNDYVSVIWFNEGHTYRADDIPQACLEKTEEPQPTP
jgi:hypothetical protein